MCQPCYLLMLSFSVDSHSVFSCILLSPEILCQDCKYCAYNIYLTRRTNQLLSLNPQNSYSINVFSIDRYIKEKGTVMNLFYKIDEKI